MWAVWIFRYSVRGSALPQCGIATYRNVGCSNLSIFCSWFSLIPQCGLFESFDILFVVQPYHNVGCLNLSIFCSWFSLATMWAVWIFRYSVRGSALPQCGELVPFRLRVMWDIISGVSRTCKIAPHVGSEWRFSYRPHCGWCTVSRPVCNGPNLCRWWSWPPPLPFWSVPLRRIISQIAVCGSRAASYWSAAVMTLRTNLAVNTALSRISFPAPMDSSAWYIKAHWLSVKSARYYRSTLELLDSLRKRREGYQCNMKKQLLAELILCCALIVTEGAVLDGES